MIHLSKRLFYAIEAVVYIAYNTGGVPTSGKELAERQNMPARYLEQMMQKLVRTGILRGVRGPRGGYLLAKEKRLITLADICSALEETEEAIHSTSLGNQVVLPVVNTLKAMYNEQLGAINLAQLCDNAAKLQIARGNENANDFTI